MRRVVVTPTFAAGLGVVVAAVLAYPMRTVFSYATPNGGSSCKVVACGVPSQGGGQPASGSRHRLATPPTGGTGTGHQSSTQHTSQGGTGPALAAAPHLSFRISGKAQLGFNGAIMIAFRPGSAQAQWRLRFGYRSARILKVWAGRYLQHGVHTVVVTSRDLPRQASSGKPVSVWIGVTGHPGPPRKCYFNGQACHITAHHPGQQGSSGRPGR